MITQKRREVHLFFTLPRAFAMPVTRRKTNEVHAEYVMHAQGRMQPVHENTYPRTFIGVSSL